MGIMGESRFLPRFPTPPAPSLPIQVRRASQAANAPNLVLGRRVVAFDFEEQAYQVN